MSGKRLKPEEIVMKLRQVEVLQGQGVIAAEAVGITHTPATGGAVSMAG